MRRLLVIGFMLIVSITMVSCQMTNHEDVNINLEEDGLTQSLKVGIVTRMGYLNDNHVLGDNIRMFGDKHSDIDIEILNSKRYFLDMSPWLMGLEGTGTPPDLIEITYNQMLNMYHHGKIEPFNLNDPDLQDLVLTAPDGAIIGLKTRVDPLIVYYNEEIFERVGLEKPSIDWDWSMLDHAIGTLKAAGQKVHIMSAPFALEWVTMNRYGGRISDPYDMKFSGYLNSEEAIQAAEWLTWVGTRREDYKFETPERYPNAMPYALVNGEVALAIDYAHRIGGYDYEYVVQQNDRVKIAPLPGGRDTVNVGLTMGFSIKSSSPNKDASMRLMRYLTKDREGYVHDIAKYSLQAEQRMGEVVLEVSTDRLAMIVQEIKRSVPASFFFSDTSSVGQNYHTEHVKPVFKDIIDGRSVADALAQYAEQLDVFFSTFKEDTNAYGECIRSVGGVVCR